MRGERQTLSWACEPPQGGRTFSYTGGHFHWNWAHDDQRKMVLNAIWWCAGGQVPRDGLDSPRPTAADLYKNLPETDKNPGWTEETLQPWLDAEKGEEGEDSGNTHWFIQVVQVVYGGKRSNCARIQDLNHRELA